MTVRKQVGICAKCLVAQVRSHKECFLKRSACNNVEQMLVLTKPSHYTSEINQNLPKRSHCRKVAENNYAFRPLLEGTFLEKHSRIGSYNLWRKRFPLQPFQ